MEWSLTCAWCWNNIIWKKQVDKKHSQQSRYRKFNFTLLFRNGRDAWKIFPESIFGLKRILESKVMKIMEK